MSGEYNLYYDPGNRLIYVENIQSEFPMLCGLVEADTAIRLLKA